MNNPIIHLTLMRHGRSRADDEGVYEGRYDSPLTAVGREQVQQRLAEWQAAGLSFERIFCSTLARAHTSADIIAAGLNIPLQTDPDWMEFNNGPLAGLSRPEAELRFPRPAFRNPYEPFWGSGESEWEFQSRVARALERVIRCGPGRYLVVSHGGALNVALRAAFGIPLPLNDSGVWFAFGDAGYAHLRYQPQKHIWSLLELRR